MSVPTVYRWDDANAPVLNSSAGSFVNLLRKCLVEGYGEKAGAGWTEEFSSGATVSVFKASSENGGSGSFLKVTDTGSAKYRGYEIMTTINDGLGATAEVSIYSKKTWWTIIASDKFFYIFFWEADPALKVFDYQRMQYIYFFGDLTKTIDQHFACVAGWSGVSYYMAKGLLCMSGSLETSSSYFLPDEGLISTSRLKNGGASSTPITLRSVNVGAGITFYYGKGSDKAFQQGVDFDGSQLFLGRPLICERSALPQLSYTPRYDSSLIRGFLPGFYVPSHSYDSFSNLEEITVDGRTFLIVSLYSFYNANTNVSTNSSGYGMVYNIAIEIGEDWDDIR